MISQGLKCCTHYEIRKDEIKVVCIKTKTKLQIEKLRASTINIVDLVYLFLNAMEAFSVSQVRKDLIFIIVV